VLIFDVDVKGALNLKSYFGEQCLSIFVKPPSSEELEKRLRARESENEESMSMRLERAIEELGYEDKFDFVLLNDDLNMAKSLVTAAVGNFIKK